MACNKTVGFLWVRLALLSALVTLVSPVYAVSPAHSELFSVTLSVDKVARQPSANQLKMGLKTVLVRLLGNENALNDAVVMGVLEKPKRFLTRFSYQSSPTLSVDQGQSPTQELLLTFDGQALMSQLDAANVAIWSLDRSPVLIWWGTEVSDGSLNIFQDGDTSEWARWFLAEARQRGIRIQLPLMDYEDQQWVDEDTITQLLKPRAEAASERYQAKIWALGWSRPVSGSNSWLGQGLIGIQGEVVWFESSADSAGSVKLEMLDYLARSLAERSSAATSHAGVHAHSIMVSSVLKHRDLLDLKNHLTAFNGVDSVAIQSVQQDVVALRVMLRDSVNAFNAAVAIDQRLRPVGSPLAQGDVIPEMPVDQVPVDHFMWVSEGVSQ